MAEREKRRVIRPPTNHQREEKEKKEEKEKTPNKTHPMEHSKGRQPHPDARDRRGKRIHA